MQKCDDYCSLEIRITSINYCVFFPDKLLESLYLRAYACSLCVCAIGYWAGKVGRILGIAGVRSTVE